MALDPIVGSIFADLITVTRNSYTIDRVLPLDPSELNFMPIIVTGQSGNFDVDAHPNLSPPVPDRTGDKIVIDWRSETGIVGGYLGERGIGGGLTINGVDGTGVKFTEFELADLLSGTNNDYIVVYMPWARVYGGEGNDFIQNVTPVGLSTGGVSEFYGEGGNDDLRGGNHNDLLSGGTGNDTIMGYGRGNDTLLGGADDDVIDFRFETSNYLPKVVDGGTGNDRLVAYFWDYTGNITADFSQALTSLTLPEGTTIEGIEYVVFDSGYGNDTLRDGAGNDHIKGGYGDDVFTWSGLGQDSLNGSYGSNSVNIDLSTVSAAINANTFTLSYTSSGLTHSAVLNSFSFLTAVLGSGDDYWNLTAGSQIVSSGAGSDTIDGDGLNDWFNGGSGQDNLRGRSGQDTLDGGTENDTVRGDSGNDILIGGAGADSLDGGADFDVASYESSATWVVVGLAGWTNFQDAAGDTFTAIDGLTGSNFLDYLGGDGNANWLEGLDGDDALYGYAGIDTLDGGDGNDNLFGGLGADELIGGSGWDTARYDDASAGVVAGLDGWTNFGEAAGDSYWLIEQITGSTFGDFLGGDANSNALYGLGSADMLWGYGATDWLYGGEANDTLNGGVGGDLLDGGNGTDTASYADAGAAVTAGLTGWTNFGEAAGDTFVSIENLIGSGFGDALGGDAGVNRIEGGGGNDTILGYGGADVLIGGTGNDQFQWWAGSGNDFITDFTGGNGVGDVLRLFGTPYTSFAQLQAAPGVLVQTAGQTQTEIRLGAETIYIWGILPGQFAADDFLFA